MTQQDGGPFDRLAVSKTLSRIASASVADVLSAADMPSGAKARVVGITGAPGAGKSTLIGQLAARRLQRAATLAVLAIDPTSPRSRGSLLGDRVRMDALSEDPRVFIRSLASGGAEDGLSDNLAEVVAALDSFGFEEVIIETVGVGQTAYGVRALADVEVLVLTPGAGDYVQAMKAGIMETADIYVVNKSDQPGADRVAAELLSVLRHAPHGRAPQVLQVHAGDGPGIDRLSAALDECFRQTSTIAVSAQIAQARRRHRVQKLIQRRLQETLDILPASIWEEPLQQAYRRVLDRLCAEVDERAGVDPSARRTGCDVPE